MSNTAFHTIAEAVKALLLAGTPVATDVSRGRPASRPVDEDTAVAVVIRLVGTKPEREAMRGAPRDWDTELHVEVYARGTAASGSGEELVDPVLYAVAQRIDADSTLGGLVAQLDLQGIDWDTSAEADRAGAATLTYRIRHNTANNLLA